MVTALWVFNIVALAYLGLGFVSGLATYRKLPPELRAKYSRLRIALVTSLIWPRAFRAKYRHAAG